MACGCNKQLESKHAGQTDVAAYNTDKSAVHGGPEKMTKPLEQCLFCAQKHADEALCCMNEFKYELANRSFVHGSLRSIVNHTFKSWPDIATVAREAALFWQEARYKEAQDKLVEAIKLIDAALLLANPEIKARIDAAKEKPDTESAPGK